MELDQDKPDSPEGRHEDVIAEVINRREPTTYSRSVNKSNSNATRSKSKQDREQNERQSSLQRSSRPSQMSKTRQATTLDGNDNYLLHTLHLLTPGEPSIESSSSSSFSLNLTNKLVPVENLVIPRTFNDALRKYHHETGVKKLDIDRVLSLTRLEKSKSQTCTVLTPERKPLEPITKEGQKDNNEDILTRQEREEERLKFFRACWKTEMRRRRSLCTISFADDLLDPVLYNSVLRKENARKVQSMPTMHLEPFATITGNNDPWKGIKEEKECSLPDNHNPPSSAIGLVGFQEAEADSNHRNDKLSLECDVIPSELFEAIKGPTSVGQRTNIKDDSLSTIFKNDRTLERYTNSLLESLKPGR